MKSNAKGVSVFHVWDLFQLSKSRFDRHKGGWTLRKKKISIIIHGGALMDSIILRNAGFSGCTAWKKLKPDLSNH
jgi:hypothetical protein